MKKIYSILLSSLLIPASLTAQEVTQSPICFTVRNEAPYRVYGEISTDYYTAPDGSKARHTGTFRLEKAGTKREGKDYFIDRSEFCSSGPFYQGRQLEITLRTLIPTFSCKTNIELNEIVIKGHIKKDGTTKTWATCY